MGKIQMNAPVVEMDGDEMTRVLWHWIKEILLEPFVDLKTEYYDLGIKNRDETDDKVTVSAAEAAKKHGVAVKCATITPNAQRVEEYGLKKAWSSPNGTIRRILGGAVFRAPVTVKGISPYIPSWVKPITVARHAYGDIYDAVEDVTAAGEEAFLVIERDGRELRRKRVHAFGGAGIVQGVHNSDESVYAFARSCFDYALSERLNVWFGAKDTVSKIYDGRFKNIFAGVYAGEYKKRFESEGLTYDYSLIDDVAARVIRSEGGFLWVCKNYDGDVMSDMVATAYGSLGMMSSVLVSPDNIFEFEAAHGTVTRHYYRHLKGEQTSTNSVATIWAWAGALKKRGEKDGNAKLAAFAQRLKAAAVATIEQGYMTGDLIPLFKAEGITPVKLDSRGFLFKIAEKLQ